MVMTSSDGPIATFMKLRRQRNEIIIVYNVTSLALRGDPAKSYSCFPGYDHCASDSCYLVYLIDLERQLQYGYLILLLHTVQIHMDNCIMLFLRIQYRVAVQNRQEESVSEILLGDTHFTVFR
jgi:hypothetical protein